MPQTHKHKHKSPNGSRRRRSSGGARGAHGRQLSLGYSSTAASRGRASNVHARTAMFQDETTRTLRAASRLATEVKAERMTPQEAFQMMMTIIQGLAPHAAKTSLMVVLGLFITVGLSGDTMDSGLLAANNAICVAKGFPEGYSGTSQLCKTHAGKTPQIGPENTSQLMKFIYPVGKNENDSDGYIAAMAKAKKIQDEVIYPALDEQYNYKHYLDTNLRNVQAGQRHTEKWGPLSERKQGYVDDSKAAIETLLPLKNAADAKVVDARQQHNDALTEAKTAEYKSRHGH